MHLPSTRSLCQDIGDGKKRYDYQTVFSPFSTGNIYKGIKAKCLGCKICYMHHLSGGMGRTPQPFEKLLPQLRVGVKKGKTELITDLVEPFLNDIGPLVIKIHKALPEAKFNFITKLPEEAKKVLEKYSEFENIPYHIQVTTMRDGLPILNVVKNVNSLLNVAKSVSCRIDPFVFGISYMRDFDNQIQELSEIGIKRITTNTMKLYRGQKKALPKIDLEVYSEGDTAGSAKMINADYEMAYFSAMRNICKYNNVGLGICMSRPQVRVFETAPCEGIGLNEYE